MLLYADEYTNIELKDVYEGREKAIDKHHYPLQIYIVFLCVFDYIPLKKQIFKKNLRCWHLYLNGN